MTDNTRALLEQALETLDNIPHPPWRDQELADSIRAALAAPDDIAAEMSTVADQYAHKLALDLECVLSEYSGTWYDTAISTLGAYRGAMNAIHERESPTFMGEPVLRDEPDKPADKPPTPAWHDAPEVAALKAERDALLKDAERYRFIRDADRSDCITRELSLYALESLDEYVDAAMEDEARAAIAKAEGGAA